LIVGVRRIVLHRHRILGTWVAPGGHVDPGETPWDAALRESEEEIGFALTHLYTTPALSHVDVREGPRGHTDLDLRYLLDGKDADADPPSDESQEVAWFAWEQAATVAAPCMQASSATCRGPETHRWRDRRPSRRSESPPAPWVITCLGTAGITVALAVVAIGQLDETWGVYALIGTVLHLSSIGLTFAYHIPRNNVLGALDPGDPDAADTCRIYVTGWTKSNHVRAATSLATAVTFILALGVG
jgi:ADP-ribose pyrophosphatase YjhB (NUDIX family)